MSQLSTAGCHKSGHHLGDLRSGEKSDGNLLSCLKGDSQIFVVKLYCCEINDSVFFHSEGKKFWLLIADIDLILQGLFISVSEFEIITRFLVR